MAGDIFTLDADNNAAVRTVSVNAGASETNSPVIFTTDEDGNAAVRVVGAGGGSDQHNLGWYATQSALETAHPTAEDGDWAIVGATDTVWVWDSDTNAWKDTDQKGQVTSVNGQTGAVVLSASDVGAATAAQGAKADTAIQSVKTINGQSIVGEGNVDLEQIQVSALPTASADELGKIYQYIGATDSTYTNAYFYKCVSDGQSPATYSWIQVEVQPAGSSLPSQTGQSGKFLTTDGTDASWSDKPLVNIATDSYSLNVSGLATSARYCCVLGNSASAGGGSLYAVAVGGNTQANESGTAIGYRAQSFSYGIAIGYYSSCQRSNITSDTWAIAIGQEAKSSANYAIQLGKGTNSDINTFKVANSNGNFELMSADGTIPKERLVNAVSTPSTMPELTVAGWSNNTQTVTVTGVTATNTVFVSPAPASASDYASAGIICTAQGTDSLTFTCTTVPTNAITVNVVIMG